MNYKKQGDMGLGRAIAYFTKIGKMVALPLSDSQDYDLVVEVGGYLQKVQVKTTTSRKNKNSYCVDLRIKGPKNSIQRLGNSLDYDLLFIVTEEGEYLIPKSVIKDLKNSITVGGKSYQNFKL